MYGMQALTESRGRFAFSPPTPFLFCQYTIYSLMYTDRDITSITQWCLKHTLFNDPL